MPDAATYSHEKVLEQQALAIADDRVKLRARLNRTKSCLVSELRAKFMNSKFDFANKRLVGDGFVLQWLLRKYPTQPTSYENQQTSVGHVAVLEIPKQQ